MARRKIVNDPVHGFIALRGDLTLQLIDHPWFQRLRRISQLGLSHLVYPGATHNRFHHAIGAMHLMQGAIEELRLKGHSIDDSDREGAALAILLHDIGHGPFSHALEHSLVKGVHHETLSLLIMEQLNTEFKGALSTAIEIFTGGHERKFLHQLVSSQLDMDRMDYLRRDSFYSGVTEGKVGSSRIIKMLDIADDQLVVEEKGIYSIEKFIVARRLMYWQVYLHKTVLAAEHMLVAILRRARELVEQGTALFGSPALQLFLSERFTETDFSDNPQLLSQFCKLDDYDILGAIKVWQEADDVLLADLCKRLVSRRLFKIDLRKTPIEPAEIEHLRLKATKIFGLSPNEASYYVIADTIDNRAYNKAAHSIFVKFKDGSIVDAATASDHLNLSALSQTVEKHFMCFPKELLD